MWNWQSCQLNMTMTHFFILWLCGNVLLSYKKNDEPSYWNRSVTCTSMILSKLRFYFLIHFEWLIGHTCLLFRVVCVWLTWFCPSWHPPEDSDLPIDLQAIYTPFLSEDIGVGVIQISKGCEFVIRVCVVLVRGEGHGCRVLKPEGGTQTYPH